MRVLTGSAIMWRKVPRGETFKLSAKWQCNIGSNVLQLLLYLASSRYCAPWAAPDPHTDKCSNRHRHQKVPKAGDATSLGLFVAQRRRVSIIRAVLLMLRSVGKISGSCHSADQTAVSEHGQLYQHGNRY